LKRLEEEAAQLRKETEEAAAAALEQHNLKVK